MNSEDFRIMVLLTIKRKRKLTAENIRSDLYGAEEEEDDSCCVLSDKWQYERQSGRWSHIDSNTENGGMRSCSSRDSVMTDDTVEDTDSASPVLHTRSINNSLSVHIPGGQAFSDDSSTSPHSPKPKRQSEKKPGRSGSFFQRVGSLRRSTKQTKRPAVTGISISGPMLVSSAEVEEKMTRLGCVDIRHGDLINNNALVRSASADGTVCACDTASLDTAITQYMLPADYVLGTFPKELLETTISTPANSVSSGGGARPCVHCDSGPHSSRRRHSDSKPVANRSSIYDNVPEEPPPSPPLPSADERLRGLPEVETARRELDAVLHDLLANITSLALDEDTSDNIHSLLSQSVSCEDPSDSAIVSPTSEEVSSLTDASHHTADSLTPADTPELRRPPDRMPGSDGSHEDVRETVWNRRDSGVGSSLTREPLERKKKARLRWHSFVASHRPSFNSQNQHISSLSAGQLMYLKKLSLLKVTSLMEQYSPSHKSGFSLIVNRFIKKGSRTPDYDEKKVFGVPLSLILQRTGQPLPQCILHAMRYLRKSAPDSVGIFRKSGVKSRIQKLRNDLEQDPDNCTPFDSLQAYDVADMFKQYLRELPECLVTNKLSETFLAIYQHVPPEQRLEALQGCVLLLPDENREVLESLLYFLSDMASYSEENQMPASNLAMCFAPSLFNIHNRAQSKSPKSDRKNIGIPDQREFLEQKSATDCLTSMILDCKKVFRVPEDFLSKCSLSYMEVGEPAPLSLLGNDGDYSTHLDCCFQGLMKESKEKGWTSVSLLPSRSLENIELSYKKMHDGNPLRLWKCAAELDAPPVELLHRVLNERQKWDEDLSKWRVVEKLDQQLDVFQYVCNSMAPQPAREYITLRAWKTDLPKGACALVMHSIDYEASSLCGGGAIRGIVLASRYLIEPTTSGKSRLTHISRVDCRGRSAKWYNRSYGRITANNLLKIKDSLTKPQSIMPHETNV